MNIKLVNFTTPWYKCQTSNCYKSFNFQKISKIENRLESNFVGFILLIKFKYNRYCIYGLNWVLAIIVKKFKTHYYMVIPLFCKIHSYKKKKTSQGEFLIRCGAQLA